MDNEMQQTNPDWYKELQYQDVKVYIKDNINSASRSFVAIGYYLKYVRDNQLYSEDGYSSIWEFAQGEFSIGKSSASSFMSINDKFSVDGNSPILLEQYRDFTSSKLAEMLTLSEEQLEQVTPVTTRAEIREMKQPVKEVESVLHAEQEQEPVTIDDLDFTVRTYNCLKRASIDTIDELCELTRDEVISIRNFSHRCLDEIYMKLSGIGRCLKEERQLPRCMHDTDTECNMINTKPVAESLGMDCNGTCCWGCKELCGARCNASANRPVEPIEESKSIVTENEFILGFYERLYDDEKQFSQDRESTQLRLELIERHGKRYSSGNYATKNGGTFSCYPDKIVFRQDKDYENQIQLSWGKYVSRLFELLDTESKTKLDPVETVEADIIQTEPEECFADQCADRGLKFNNWLKANNFSIAQIVSDILCDIPLANDKDPFLSSKVTNRLISSLIIKTDAYYSYLTKELDIEPEPVKSEQPELPILRNNDQRKEFIEAYTTWPIWIDIKETGERYYRYNLSDKVAMVVKVSLRHTRINYERTDDISYGAEQYYLLGVSANYSAKTIFTEDDTWTFFECNGSKSVLVDYLKDYQRK